MPKNIKSTRRKAATKPDALVTYHGHATLVSVTACFNLEGWADASSDTSDRAFGKATGLAAAIGEPAATSRRISTKTIWVILLMPVSQYGLRDYCQHYFEAFLRVFSNRISSPHSVMVRFFVCSIAPSAPFAGKSAAARSAPRMT